LRIWQQNLNTSMVTQESLLNYPITKHWDVIIIQEPYINFLQNTKANHRWHVLYLTQHYTHPQKHSYTITLVNANLDTNIWNQITFPSSDIVILQISSEISKFTIFNIYNNGGYQDTLIKLDI
ncbi:hypothetical protein BDR06DRAFT_880710, partial [Suillus hirtellus]